MALAWAATAVEAVSCSAKVFVVPLKSWRTESACAGVFIRMFSSR